MRQAINPNKLGWTDKSFHGALTHAQEQSAGAVPLRGQLIKGR